MAFEERLWLMNTAGKYRWYDLDTDTWEEAETPFDATAQVPDPVPTRVPFRFAS